VSGRSLGEYPDPGPPAVLDRDKRAQQGSDQVTGWCPTCRERAVPMRNGTCGFCSTQLVGETGGKVPIVSKQETVPDRLAELAVIAVAEHARVGALAAKALEHAMRCGEAITELRGMLPASEWKDWLLSRTGITHSTALLYQRIAANADELQEAGVPSVSKARRYLQDHGLIADVAPLPTTEQKERVLILSEARWPTSRIAERVGLDPKTVTAIRRGRHRGKRGRPRRPPPSDNRQPHRARRSVARGPVRRLRLPRAGQRRGPRRRRKAPGRRV
jgi:hypothetical protein